MTGPATSSALPRRAGTHADRLGVVIIGRNEGARLPRCIEAVGTALDQRVYVDSGSTDGSPTLAAGLGLDVIELDAGEPFSAARARNVGYRHLLRNAPNLRYVQFLDGDCEIVSTWLGCAVDFLDAHPNVAAVCGRLLERHPEQSIYNLLCDIEWDGPVGEVRATGGNVLIRVEPLQQIGGFRTDLIAGEEPELCLRLRKAGWRIWRLGHDMAFHDAAMHRFAQWWQRMVRAGHARAQGARLHGHEPERYNVRESRSALFWGFLLPIAIAAALAIYGSAGAALLLLYPLQVVRLALRAGRAPWIRSLFTVLGKFPEAEGNLRFWLHRWRGRASQLIEYK